MFVYQGGSCRRVKHLCIGPCSHSWRLKGHELFRWLSHFIWLVDYLCTQFYVSSNAKFTKIADITIDKLNALTIVGCSLKAFQSKKPRRHFLRLKGMLVKLFYDNFKTKASRLFTVVNIGSEILKQFACHV